MLGIGCPDRHALPRFTLVENAPTTTYAPLPRERVRSSTHCGHSCAPIATPALAPLRPLARSARFGSIDDSARAALLADIRARLQAYIGDQGMAFPIQSNIVVARPGEEVITGKPRTANGLWYLRGYGRRDVNRSPTSTAPKRQARANGKRSSFPD